MTSHEIYKRFLLKLNKNDSNAGVNILPSSFILLFNNEAIKWAKDKLKSDDDSLTDIAYDLLLTDVEISVVKKFSDSIEFSLPENFYKHASSYSVVNKGNCVGVRIFNFEKKAVGYQNLLADDYSKASFDYEETPFVIASRKMKIFFDDFEIKKVFLSYYKLPDEIDIEGYTKFDGYTSTNIDSNLSPDNIDEILNRLVLEIDRETENAEGFQFSKERVQTEP